MTPEHKHDLWILPAISSYLCALFVADEFGPNFVEFKKAHLRFDWKKDPTALLDFHSVFRADTFTDLDDLLAVDVERVAKKGLLVMLLLERIMGPVEFKSFFKSFLGGFGGEGRAKRVVSAQRLERKMFAKVRARQIKDVWIFFCFLCLFLIF